MKTPASIKTNLLNTWLLAGFLLVSGFTGDPALAPASPAGEKSPSPFTLVRNENDIRLWSRWLPVTGTKSARELRADLTCPCPARMIVELVCNDAAYTRWMKGSHSCNRLRTVDSSHWYTYIRFAAPWPLNDQDCIMHCTLSVSADGSEYVITEDSFSSYMKPVSGVTRIPHLQCKWVIRAVSENTTRVEYTLFSKQVSKIPRWISDPIIQGHLMDSMSAFRQMVTSAAS